MEELWTGLSWIERLEALIFSAATIYAVYLWGSGVFPALLRLNDIVASMITTSYEKG
jgi:hypothetical protein